MGNAEEPLDEPTIQEIAERIEKDREERAKADRSFVVCGETFTYRAAVAPETLARYYDMVTGMLTTLTNVEALEIIDTTILSFLEPGQEEKWQKIRDPEFENPLTHQELHSLIEGLLRSLSGRPTGASSVSTDGRAATTTNSTGGSRSKVST